MTYELFEATYAKDFTVGFKADEDTKITHTEGMSEVVVTRNHQEFGEIQTVYCLDKALFWTVKFAQ